jgi:hypothetical protein
VPNRRAVTAYVMMFLFIIATSIGCGLVFSPGATLIALGLTSGITGYLLGAD